MAGQSSITFEVRGINQQIEQLVKAGEITEDATIKGLLAASLLIQARAQKRVPVEYGFLRGSAFARRSPDGKLQVEVGFSAAYAKWVHDLTAEKLRGQPRRSGLGTYWNPGESLFLLKALVETRIGEITSLIAGFMRRGGGPRA